MNLHAPIADTRERIQSAKIALRDAVIAHDVERYGKAHERHGRCGKPHGHRDYGFILTGMLLALVAMFAVSAAFLAHTVHV